MKMGKNKRIDWIDYCKAIAIFAMVFDHVCLGLPERSRELSNFIHLWHMPMFFMLSGIVLNSDKYIGWGNFKTFIANRTKTIILPYFCFGIIYMAFSYISINVIGISGVPHPLDKRLIGFIWNNIPGQIGIFWFLTSLYFTEIVFAVITNVFRQHKSAIVAYLALLVLGFWKINAIGINLPFALDTVPFTLPFFCVGYYAKKVFSGFRPNRTVQVCIVCLVVASALLGGHYNINLRTFDYHPHLIIVASILITWCMIELVKRLESSISNSKAHSFVSFLGRESLFVYVMNFMVIKAVLFAVPKSRVTTTAVSIAVSLAATIIVVLVILAIRKLFSRPIEIMLGKF